MLTTNVGQPQVTATQQDTTGARRETPGRPTLRLRFSAREAARLSGIHYHTLAHWCRKGWIRRVDGMFTGWMLIGLALLHESGRGKGKGSYVGDVGVKKMMAAIAGLDDALRRTSRGDRIDRVAARRTS